jgi:hypothetical protein
MLLGQTGCCSQEEPKQLDWSISGSHCIGAPFTSRTAHSNLPRHGCQVKFIEGKISKKTAAGVVALLAMVMSTARDNKEKNNTDAIFCCWKVIYLVTV